MAYSPPPEIRAVDNALTIVVAREGIEEIMEMLAEQS